MKKIIVLGALVSLPLLLTGCPSLQSYLASKPPAFAKGYTDGCKSGEKFWENNLANYKIIDPALKEDPDYKEGWEEGYNRCYSDKEVEIWMRRR
ncbi:hypothetical protein [Hydrogenimonas urashimensis]|uniref:hypothetical protein n=1 Tax=Hydrogenimonas urashimensis TaxID=2740515 RepID=UPI001915C996|nr:hypothetical protein [Hydrogenimonas urashimensis]